MNLQSRIFEIKNLLDPVTFPETFCSCSFEQLKLEDESLALLFWFVYIDETVYWTLMDKNNPNCLHNDLLYNKYRKKYPFPKFYAHGTASHLSPAKLLYNIPFTNILKRLLLNYKHEVWDKALKMFFLIEGEEGIVATLETEFYNDLKNRIRFSEEEENNLCFLWNNNQEF